MQGALYLSVELGERASIYVHEELGQGAARAFEPPSSASLPVALPADAAPRIARRSGIRY